MLFLNSKAFLAMTYKKNPLNDIYQGKCMPKTQFVVNIYPWSCKVASENNIGFVTVSWTWCRKGKQSTSEVLNKVLQFHLPLRLDVGAVHVRVEEDDGKGQDEDGVGVPELSHHTRVANAVALAAKRIMDTEALTSN